MSSDDTISIERFLPHEVSGEQLRRLVVLENALHAEERPGDPPRPSDYYRKRYLSWTHLAEVSWWHWWALRRGAPIGVATAGLRRAGDNPHLLRMDLKVIPECRRQGVGRRLLRHVLEAARVAGGRSLLTEVHGPEPLAERPGTAFGYAIGAEPRRQEHFNRLLIDEVDPALLAAWLEPGRSRSPEFELVWRQAPLPEDELEPMAELIQRTTAGEPTDDLEVEPMVFTGESIRQWMAAWRQEGRNVHVATARHVPSLVLAGFTMMTTDPANDGVFDQFGTGVLPEFRRRGLGRWLKAAMLRRMTESYPERREVRTGNADSNAAMLAINRRLGFRPWVASCTWQVSVDAVERYLGRKG